MRHSVDIFKPASGGKGLPVLSFGDQHGVRFGVPRWVKLLEIFSDEENVKAIKSFVRSQGNT